MCLYVSHVSKAHFPCVWENLFHFSPVFKIRIGQSNNTIVGYCFMIVMIITVIIVISSIISISAIIQSQFLQNTGSSHSRQDLFKKTCTQGLSGQAFCVLNPWRFQTGTEVGFVSAFYARSLVCVSNILSFWPFVIKDLYDAIWPFFQWHLWRALLFANYMEGGAVVAMVSSVLCVQEGP